MEQMCKILKYFFMCSLHVTFFLSFCELSWIHLLGRFLAPGECPILFCWFLEVAHISAFLSAALGKVSLFLSKVSWRIRALKPISSCLLKGIITAIPSLPVILFAFY